MCAASGCVVAPAYAWMVVNVTGLVVNAFRSPLLALLVGRIDVGARKKLI